jgi:excisionase family DNA binding protein
MQEEERIYTVEEVAKQLRVNARTVRSWIASGELIALDVGREYRITQTDLDAFKEKRKTDKRKKD